jgi:hypothetical protein
MKIARIDDSFHFPGRAVVITGDCGHKHVRASLAAALLRPGDTMYCLFCDDTGTPPGKTTTNTWD